VDSYQFDEESAHAKVQAFSVASVLEQFGIEHLDVLKVDVEGAERAIFSSSASWITRIRMFVVELHNPEADRVFTAAIAGLRTDRMRKGENDIVKVYQP
jgi:hypothetical protein